MVFPCWVPVSKPETFADTTVANPAALCATSARNLVRLTRVGAIKYNASVHCLVHFPHPQPDLFNSSRCNSTTVLPFKESNLCQL